MNDKSKRLPTCWFHALFFHVLQCNYTRKCVSNSLTQHAYIFADTVSQKNNYHEETL